MKKQHRLLFVVCGFLCVMTLALWPGLWLQSAYANVTLVSFTATSLPGQPEIYIVWETATEFHTVGFFIVRSDSAAGEFTRISEFIQHAGDTIVGAQYGYIDENTVLNQAYWYKLEEITGSQQSEFYGPIRAVAGVPATETPTVTATPTPSRTPTRTPTSTPTTTDSSASSNTVIMVTPRVASGATVTPRAASAGSPANPVEPTVAPPLFSDTNETQPSETISTPDLSSSNVPTVDTAAPPPSASVDVGQVIAPTLAPIDEGAAIAAPIVITPASTPSAAASSTPAAPLILIAAAVLFLGIAFVILRQAGR
jgi:hypothetical protein